MSPTNLAALPSDKPAPTGLVQLKRGAVDGTTNYNNTVPNGTVIHDGTGAPMRIAITPTLAGWWLIRAEAIISCLDAAWAYCYWKVALSPADADGFSIDGAHHPIHSTLSWQESCIDTAYRLNAGIAYTATMQWWGSSGYNQPFWTGKDYLYIAGEFVAEGSV